MINNFKYIFTMLFFVQFSLIVQGTSSNILYIFCIKISSFFFERVHNSDAYIGYKRKNCNGVLSELNTIRTSFNNATSLVITTNYV